DGVVADTFDVVTQCESISRTHWGSWQGLGGSTNNGPAAVAFSSPVVGQQYGARAYYVDSTDSKLRQNTFGCQIFLCGWFGWASPHSGGPQLAFDPDAARAKVGSNFWVVATGTDGRPYVALNSGGGLAPFTTPLAGGLPLGGPATIVAPTSGTQTADVFG